MSYLLIYGDSRRLPINLASVDAIVSDPPYGIGYRHSGGTNSSGYSRNGRGKCVSNTDSIIGDDKPFDPRSWLGIPCLFFGAQYFFDRLPMGGSWLAWDKAATGGPADVFTDCDFAWCSVSRIKRNIFRYTWKGASCVKADEHNGTGQVIRVHPSQKPIVLMRWCIQKLDLKPNSLIFDPYMGSGSTGVAALAEGHRFVGIEIDRRYCVIAQRRITRPHARPIRPAREEVHPLFDQTEVSE
jgi:site-specific DNA-methyltransferase (adenine-specific)